MTVTKFEAPGPVAVVTGASSGIGRASAIALSAAGWRVVLCGRREDQLKATADKCETESSVSVCDIQNEDDVKKLFEHTIKTFGKLDLLFNNAGFSGSLAMFGETDMENVKKVFQVNIVGAILCAREAFRIFRHQGTGGRIINNGSIAAHVPRPGSLAYTMSKHATTGLTKQIALDGRDLNIACTQIDIGNAVTEMTQNGPQGSGAEHMIDAVHVADTVVHIASMPNSVTMLSVNIMPTRMPYVGRG